MNNMNLLSRCQQVLNIAADCGADSAEVYGNATRQITVSIEKNDLQIARSQQEEMIGIRALVDKKIGFACTNSFDDLRESFADAVRLAKASPPDPHNGLPETTDVTYVDGIYDEAADNFGVKDALTYAIRMLGIAKDMDKRLILGDASFAAQVGQRAIVNTDGMALAEPSSLFRYHALATAREGDKVSNMDYQFGASRTVDNIDVDPITRLACENALGSLGAQKGKSFSGTVLLSPNAVLSIIASLILFQINAKNALRGMSKWANSLGQTVASSKLTVVDDGLLPSGVATASFDREGTPHNKLTILDHGKLSALMHNSYTATAMKCENTGHASGSARSVPDIGATNLQFLPGDVIKDDLIADIKKGVFVTRFSGSADPISGDFSGVAKGAYLIENGSISCPIRGTLIAGNTFSALKEISGISKERKSIMSFVLPYIRLENISVTAG